MRELQVVQGTQEWLEARAKCFTASEAPAMMGVSPYKKRSELIREKATGIVPEVDEATQRRFDAGHEAEKKARQIAEEILGEELYPVTAVTDDGKFLASSDGATMLYDIGWEHKLYNAKLAHSITEENAVPESHKWQLVHQCMVFGFKKIMFSISDGTKENFIYCWFVPTEEDTRRLISGWNQFQDDVKNYKPESEARPELVTGSSPESLPALRIEVSGMVTFSNLDVFKSKAMDVISGIKTELITDQDFADADKTAKWLGDIETRLREAKRQALEQTESIDKLFSTLDEIAALSASTRLKLEKLVKAEKESRKAALVITAKEEMAKYIDEKNRTVEGLLPAFPIDFAGVIKGLKTLDSMREKISVAIANAKVHVSEVSDRIAKNLGKLSPDQRALLPDLRSLADKPSDEFDAILAGREAQHREREERRIAAEVERIRREEEAKAKAAAESQAKMQEEPRIKPEPSVQKVTAQTAPASNDDKVSLMQVCDALGFIVTEKFLAGIGVKAVGSDRRSSYYDAASFPTICRLIQEHLGKVMFMKPAKKAA